MKKKSDGPYLTEQAQAQLSSMGIVGAMTHGPATAGVTLARVCSVALVDAIKVMASHVMLVRQSEPI